MSYRQPSYLKTSKTSRRKLRNKKKQRYATTPSLTRRMKTRKTKTVREKGRTRLLHNPERLPSLARKVS